MRRPADGFSFNFAGDLPNAATGTRAAASAKLAMAKGDVGGNRSNEGGVNTARQTNHNIRESILCDEITSRKNERVPYFGFFRECFGNA